MKFALQPPPAYHLETVRNSGSSPCPVRYAAYDIADIVSGRRVLNIDVKHEVVPKHAHIIPSTLTAHRFQTGLCFFLDFIITSTTKGDGRLCFRRRRQLPSTSSSPIITKLRQSYAWPQGTRSLNFGRSG